jgi:type II secretory pathway pseudopilin PulG
MPTQSFSRHFLLQGKTCSSSFSYCSFSKVLHSKYSGFSLAELLVSAVIIGVLGVSVASVLNTGNSFFRSTRESNTLEQATDKDLAMIKDIAFRMTCCSGSCTTETDTQSPCSPNTVPGNQNYYFPSSALDTDETAIKAFETKCSNGALVGELIKLIGSADLPIGITRSFETSDASSHRLTVIYQSSAENRAYTFVPTVAAWCP